MAKLPSILVKSAAPVVEADIIPVFQGGSSASSAAKGPYGALAKRFGAKGPSSEFMSLQFVRFGGIGKAAHVLFGGMGRQKDVTDERARFVGALAWQKLSSERVKSVALHADFFGETRLARAFVEGMLLASYRFDKHKSVPRAEDSALGKIFVYS